MSEWIAPLPWDTDFFGAKIGRIIPCLLECSTLYANLTQAERAEYQCLYFEADPHDATTVTLAERYGFHLVDVRVVLDQTLDEHPGLLSYLPEPMVIRTGSHRLEDMPLLEEIAVETGHLSRFQFDSRFPADACPRLYRAWLHKAFADETGTAIISYWDDVAAGLITCESTDGVGHIVLAGVHSRFRGRGVGTALVRASLNWFRTQGDSRAQVVTQARNVPAQRLYQQMGFFTRSVTLMYHKWL